MEPYLFTGVVRPERAELSVGWGLDASIGESAGTARIEVSIVKNQVAVWVYTEVELDILDLRNAVQHLVEVWLAAIAFIKGLAYTLEIVRAINKTKGVDHIFGIGISCLEARGDAKDVSKELGAVIAGCDGINGEFVRLALQDLLSAMRSPHDTAFYCYRALESLVHHFAAENQLGDAARDKQWTHFWDALGASRNKIDAVQRRADRRRHVRLDYLTGDQRAELFSQTWDVAEKYFEFLSRKRAQ